MTDERDGRPRPGETTDDVVLLDEEARPCGVADRTQVHTTDTPLHLAFSIHLRDETGAVLLTRRALGKATWPGVWTNSCCGHPRPGESMDDAIHRRVEQELGVQVSDVRCVLPEYRYRAVDASGVVENEVCPVHLGTVRRAQLRPDPAEVAEHGWVSWADLVATAAALPVLLSLWSVEQVTLIQQVASGDPWGQG